MSTDTLSPERMAERPTRDLVLIANAGAMPTADVVMALAGDLAAEELARREGDAR